MNAQKLAEDYLIYRCLAGSHAYGTNIASSDVDTRGIFIAPPKVTLGYAYTIGEVADDKQDDKTYELRKFTKLAAECNPNIIELLWNDECNIQFIAPAFKAYRDNKHLFMSKLAKHKFSGYAMAQLKRIRGHNKWINNPQTEAPPRLVQYSRWIDQTGDDCTTYLREQIHWFNSHHLLVKINEFTFRVYAVFNTDKFKPGVFTENGEQVSSIDIDLDTLEPRCLGYKGILFAHMSDYRAARDNWKQYWTWKRERNAVRNELEIKFGYDTKHAMHLVRLMRMGEEILRDGIVHVNRPDAAELLSIRQGAWTYEQIIDWATKQDAKLTEMYNDSPLPHSVDTDAINDLYIKTIMNYWKEKELL